ncbi:hypothetical protein FQR65_LT06630 [Abscondita terminalis]|nr:hypothetical protein FQR65_LT06630 [Abscondita terminalis]
MFIKLALIGCIVVSCMAQEGGYGHHHVDYYAHPKYKFKYGVSDDHTHDHHNQHETRDGDVVHGEYSLHEPDGTIRIVKYTADHKNGFNAEVIKKGHAKHPETHVKHPFAVFHHHHDHGHPKYTFKYGVSDDHTHDHHNQHESRDGDVVHGEYSLHEPDGTIRIVKYTADHKNGFNAEVIKKGHAKHPETHVKHPFAVFHHHHDHGYY